MTRTDPGSHLDTLDEEDGTPLIRIMVRPRWIGMLLFCLALAAVFAALGQWQLSKAIASGHVVDVPTETVRQLNAVVQPDTVFRDDVTGQKVRFRGTYDTEDFTLLQGRLNYGTAGYWVVGHVNTDPGDAAIAVAVGWAPTRARAESAVRELSDRAPSEVTVQGRVLPDEAPADPPDPSNNPWEQQDLSSAALYNLWHVGPNQPVYAAYVVSHDPTAGLDAIYSPPPLQQATLDWLNVFYAAEWAIFALFALYFWYRLCRDAKEREDQEREEALAALHDAALLDGEMPDAAMPDAGEATLHDAAVPGSHPARRT